MAGKPLQHGCKGHRPTLVVDASPLEIFGPYCNVTDCLLTNPGRVETFFGKSAILIEILQKRQPEVSEEFGGEVGATISSAFDTLQEAARLKAFAR
jgi:hypothetical protein